MSHTPVVYVVDNYVQLRKALKSMLENHDFEVVLCDSASSFLKRWDQTRPGVLILDYDMPHMNGLELQAHLRELRAPVPILFLTGLGTIRVAVTACQNGAVEFLEKPVDEPDLIPKVHQHVHRACEEFDQRIEANELAQLLGTLTTREREVLGYLLKGENPKAISNRFGTSEHTVRNQRTSILNKMNAESLPELVHMVNLVKRWDTAS